MTLSLGQKLTGRPVDRMDGDLLLCPWPGRLHMCGYWQQDPTELVIAPQETASQAKGHLEPPMLAQLPRKA